MRRLIVLLTVLAILALPSAVAAGGRPFVTSLTGAAEVPGPGDPDGSGTAWLTLNAGTGEVCWTIFVEDIMLPTWGAHIHEAPAGVAGPVVVGLSAPDESGLSSGCTTADREEILEIILEPDQYYVNVHNDEYPDGALRGQLSR